MEILLLMTLRSNQLFLRIFHINIKYLFYIFFMIILFPAALQVILKRGSHQLCSWSKQALGGPPIQAICCLFFHSGNSSDTSESWICSATVSALAISFITFCTHIHAIFKKKYDTEKNCDIKATLKSTLTFCPCNL